MSTPTNKIVATIDLPPSGSGSRGAAGNLTYGAGAVWVSNGIDSVMRIDPTSNTFTASLNVDTASVQGSALTPGELAVGGDVVWVADPFGFLMEIDAMTPLVRVIDLEQLVDPNGPPFGSIVADDEGVWRFAPVYPSRSRLIRVDRESGAIQRKVPIAESLFGLAEGEGYLWGFGAGAFLKMNPETGQVVLRIKLPRIVSSGDIAVGEGGVWVSRSLDFKTEQLLKIDPASGEVRSVTFAGAGGVVGASASALWLLGPTQVASHGRCK